VRAPAPHPRTRRLHTVTGAMLTRARVLTQAFGSGEEYPLMRERAITPWLVQPLGPRGGRGRRRSLHLTEGAADELTKLERVTLGQARAGLSGDAIEPDDGPTPPGGGRRAASSGTQAAPSALLRGRDPLPLDGETRGCPSRFTIGTRPQCLSRLGGGLPIGGTTVPRGTPCSEKRCGTP
jgi:hypothetical protein